MTEQQERAAVVAEAKAWLGTPYHHRAKLKGVGVDCAQLPIAIYAAVGLNPEEAWHTAMHNPHYQETIRWAGERIMAFLSDAGLVGAPGMRWWHRSFLLAK